MLRKNHEKSDIFFQGQELDIKSAVPLYYQLKELIQAQIADNHWRQGQMIPSENELAEAFKVSSGTVKKALGELVSQGLLTRRQGKGTFVAKPDFNKSFIRFFRFGSKKEGVFPHSKVLASGTVDPMPEVAKALKLEPGQRTILIRRLRILEDIPLMLEDIHLPEEIFKGFDELDISQKLLYPIYDRKYHTPIIWAEEFLKPLTATQEAAGYLAIEPGQAVISIERIAYTYQDRPVEFRKSLGRGDKFSYHIEIR
ncbi:GntR family transcriptional regulator [Dethiosulfatarculus sandiegensis]|uniref:HTH gntR-type domain-containing protein n=1 Tax=Dethiosulfatarculus sandiegensis TaxID=1429043 RepID=A0A0D2JA38_9BACT|nr:GntR family transcriptional regulator [Dethiosulfatarculus sandiegensis]KIX12551.1 hypothetical protein X474_18275 [Dethiosulfatarculus sandiegensis]